MPRLLFYHNLLILTWRNPHESLKFFYPNAMKLLIIGSWTFSNCVPSSLRESSQKKWHDTFEEIVEFDVEDPNVKEKVLETLSNSTGDWILLCTDDRQVNREIAEKLGIHLVSGSRAVLEDEESSMESVY
jgi:hypothetical protein